MNAGKREDILGRIREALRVPAPRLHAGHGTAPAQSSQPDRGHGFRQCLPTQRVSLTCSKETASNSKPTFS